MEPATLNPGSTSGSDVMLRATFTAAEGNLSALSATRSGRNISVGRWPAGADHTLVGFGESADDTFGVIAWAGGSSDWTAAASPARCGWPLAAASMPSVEATLGYGLAAFGEQGLLTPYAGLSLSGTGTRRVTWAGAWRWCRRSS